MAHEIFRFNRRSRHLLQFLVDAALDGRLAELQEQNIGVAVFGRSPEFDAAADAIVRISMTDVRKRLSDFYETGPDSAVRIDIEAGSFVPEFHFRLAPSVEVAERELPELPPEEDRVGRWRIVAGALAALVVLLMLAVIFWPKPQSESDRFWAVGPSNGPALIGLAAPDRVEQVGSGEAQAAAYLSRAASQRGFAVSLRLGEPLTYSDARQGPAVILGGVLMPWLNEVLQPLRFAMRTGERGLVVVDREGGGAAWQARFGADGQAVEDFALVTRLHRAGSTGHTMIVSVGTTHYGTSAAAEFLSSGALDQALHGAPSGWEDGNVQLVLRTSVTGATPGPAQVVAVHYWK